MQLPSPLPEHLEKYSVAESSEKLLEMLKKKPVDLAVFFEHACLDETWSKTEHPNFVRYAMDWLDKKVLNDELHHSLVDLVAEAIHRHQKNLHHLIPSNLKVIFDDREHKTNSLLVSAGSRYLYNLVRDECRDEEEPQIVLHCSFHLFEAIEDFLYYGRARKLWMREQEEIIEVLRQALEWEIQELYEECQKVLERYIELSNVYKTLIHADDEDWIILKGACIDYINQLHYGIVLKNRSEKGLTVQFSDFHYRAIQTFEKLSERVTHFIFTGEQLNDPYFLRTIEEAPILRGIDLSETQKYAIDLESLPDTITELTLSNCLWLSNKTLDKMFEILPDLIRLDLSGNQSLGINECALLQDLDELEALDLSRCGNIGDAEVSVIVQGCPDLLELYLEGCQKIKEKGFLTLARGFKELTHLDISNTEIGPGAIQEITIKCPSLQTLNISNCQNLTGHSIVMAVKMAPALTKIELSYCDIKGKEIAEIKRSMPLLTVVNS